MKFFIVAVCTFACALAALENNKEAKILKNEFDLTPEGAYEYDVETGNGIKQQASATVKKVNEKTVVAVRGTISYVGEDGKTYEIKYIADENGYQAQGEHLPTTPAPMPIPGYIQSSIEYIKNHPYKEKNVA